MSGGNAKDKTTDKVAHTARGCPTMPRVAWKFVARQAKNAKRIRDTRAKKLRFSHLSWKVLFMGIQ